MQKRAAIARAMALDPQFFFSTNCPPVWTPSHRQNSISCPKCWRAPDITFVVVTHELPSIFTIADRVIMRIRGEGIIAMGSHKNCATTVTTLGSSFLLAQCRRKISPLFFPMGKFSYFKSCFRHQRHAHRHSRVIALAWGPSSRRSLCSRLTLRVGARARRRLAV